MTMLDVAADGGTIVEQKVVAIARGLILSARDYTSIFTYIAVSAQHA